MERSLYTVDLFYSDTTVKDAGLYMLLIGDTTPVDDDLLMQLKGQ